MQISSCIGTKASLISRWNGDYFILAGILYRIKLMCGTLNFSYMFTIGAQYLYYQAYCFVAALIGDMLP